MGEDFKLYHVYEDDSGHRYLIPKAQVSALYEFIAELSQALDTNHIFYEELYNDNLSGYLEQYYLLEGEEYFVVLKGDLK